MDIESKQYEGKVVDLDGNPIYLGDEIVFARNNMYMELDSGVVIGLEKPDENGHGNVKVQSTWSGRTSTRISQHVYAKPGPDIGP